MHCFIWPVWMLEVMFHSIHKTCLVLPWNKPTNLELAGHERARVSVYVCVCIACIDIRPEAISMSRRRHPPCLPSAKIRDITLLHVRLFKAKPPNSQPKNTNSEPRITYWTTYEPPLQWKACRTWCQSPRHNKKPTTTTKNMNRTHCWDKQDREGALATGDADDTWRSTWDEQQQTKYTTAQNEGFSESPAVDWRCFHIHSCGLLFTTVCRLHTLQNFQGVQVYRSHRLS